LKTSNWKNYFISTKMDMASNDDFRKEYSPPPEGLISID
jgi:hypothetical protein